MNTQLQHYSDVLSWMNSKFYIWKHIYYDITSKQYNSVTVTIFAQSNLWRLNNAYHSNKRIFLARHHCPAWCSGKGIRLWRERSRVHILFYSNSLNQNVIVLVSLIVLCKLFIISILKNGEIIWYFRRRFSAISNCIYYR